MKHRAEPAPIVRHALQYLDTNYSRSVTLGGIARQLTVSKYYLSHMFKQSTGFSVMGYLNYRRIAEAKQMLAHTDKSVADIGTDCGFMNAQHFYRMFKKMSGMPPGRYRQKRRSGE